MSTVKLEGFKELERALAQLPKATGKNVLRRVAKAALDPVADMAANAAPHRSGRLAYSITVSEQRTRRAKKRGPKQGIEMAMGPAGGLGTLQYASFDEFGTVDTPAFGFMRQAWDNGSSGALDTVKSSLSAEIMKAAQRRARKAAKG